MQKKFWFPKTMPGRLAFFQNFRVKIGKYGPELGFPPEKVEAMENLADEFIASYTWVRSCEATMKAAFAWRDAVYGDWESGMDAPAAPVFPPPPLLNSKQGIIERMYKFRGQIVSSPAYTEGLGRDLGLVGAEIQRPQAASLAPELRVSSTAGHTVSIAGNMRKMNAVAVEYKPQNGNWSLAAFLTNLPASVVIAPAEPGALERGSIRAIFYRKNEPFGNYSVEYPVVLY